MGTGMGGEAGLMRVGRGIARILIELPDALGRQVGVCAEEYERDYRPELERRRAAQQEKEKQRQRAEMEKLRKDMEEKAKVAPGEGGD